MKTSVPNRPYSNDTQRPAATHRVVVTGLGAVTPLGFSPESMLESFRTGNAPFRASAVLPRAACCPVCHFDAATATRGWRHRRYLSRGGLFALASALEAAQDAGWGANAPEGAALITAAGPNLDIMADFPRAGHPLHNIAPTDSEKPGLDTLRPETFLSDTLPSATSRPGTLRPDTPQPGTLPSAASRPVPECASDTPHTAGLDHDGLDALWLLRWLPNTAASAIAQRLGIHGEGLVVGTACAAGLQALGEAYRRVRYGYAPCALAAAGDSRLSEGGMLGYARADALWRSKADTSGGITPDTGKENTADTSNGITANTANGIAATAMRPFDTSRSGFVPGEGGTALILETLESALARGATIYGEVLGFGATLDGGSLTAPDASARYAEKAVRLALTDAELAPGDIAWVAAHGTSTPRNDSAEALLLQQVYGAEARPPAVTALKSWTGHLASACGLAETAMLLIAARAGLMPHIRNLVAPCAGGIDFVTAPRAFPRGPGVIQSFGFGGQNAALVLQPYHA